MTYVDVGSFPRDLLIPGQAYDRISRKFRRLGQIGGGGDIDSEGSRVSSRLGPLEERLRQIQDTISDISMHLPRGFATGLNRQFANLMDDDAWEDDDEPVSLRALSAFLRVLVYTRTNRRPGIGTNGRGSITATWTEGSNRLTIECLPSERLNLVLSRLRDDEEIERAAFGPIRSERILEVLAPFNPGVWFDC